MALAEKSRQEAQEKGEKEKKEKSTRKKKKKDSKRRTKAQARALSGHTARPLSPRERRRATTRGGRLLGARAPPRSRSRSRRGAAAATTARRGAARRRGRGRGRRWARRRAGPGRRGARAAAARPRRGATVALAAAPPVALAAAALRPLAVAVAAVTVTAAALAVAAPGRGRTGSRRSRGADRPNVPVRPHSTLRWPYTLAAPDEIIIDGNTQHQERRAPRPGGESRGKTEGISPSAGRSCTWTRLREPASSRFGFGEHGHNLPPLDPPTAPFLRVVDQRRAAAQQSPTAPSSRAVVEPAIPLLIRRGLLDAAPRQRKAVDTDPTRRPTRWRCSRRGPSSQSAFPRSASSGAYGDGVAGPQLRHEPRAVVPRTPCRRRDAAEPLRRRCVRRPLGCCGGRRGLRCLQRALALALLLHAALELQAAPLYLGVGVGHDPGAGGQRRGCVQRKKMLPRV